MAVVALACAAHVHVADLILHPVTYLFRVCVAQLSTRTYRDATSVIYLLAPGCKLTKPWTDIIIPSETKAARSLARMRACVHACQSGP